MVVMAPSAWFSDFNLAVDCAGERGVAARAFIVDAAMVDHDDGTAEGFTHCVGCSDVGAHILVLAFAARYRAEYRVPIVRSKAFTFPRRSTYDDKFAILEFCAYSFG